MKIDDQEHGHRFKAFPPPYLLDVNVLIALAWPLHVHRVIAHAWFEKVGQQSWSTCPLTQLAFVRISSNAKLFPLLSAPALQFRPWATWLRWRVTFFEPMI